MGSVLCLYACSDGRWPELRRDSVTRVALGRVDSEGFILGEVVLRLVLRADSLLFGG